MQEVETSLDRAEGQDTQPTMSVKEAGARGGRSTRDKRGVAFFRRIGRKGGETTKRRWGHLYNEFGHQGGRPRRPDLQSMVEGPHKRKEGKRSARGALPPPEQRT